jgi:hypothetical protein
MYIIWWLIPKGLETKNDCASKNQQHFSRYNSASKKSMWWWPKMSFHFRLPKYTYPNLMAYASFFEIFRHKVFILLVNKCKLCPWGWQVASEDYWHSIKKVVNLVHLSPLNLYSTVALPDTSRHVGKLKFFSFMQHSRFQYVALVSRIHSKFSLINLAGSEMGSKYVFCQQEDKNGQCKD